ncbi:ATP-binding cassette domain-containing protein [Glutamicibacter sp. PS]|uniref:ATP-binding cassette domain-containing protein n=1 Tax=Glutamicibacter sp. PS TaxID=3075634 RepID=UPI0028421A4A|nr:ATP-binding cassette domain-containing protein [Glutamicibacter sp. PS]MDR4532014.1 ATP-binding cassette domain-containing protein [Glutamicibacter sp. PS]
MSAGLGEQRPATVHTQAVAVSAEDFGWRHAERERPALQGLNLSIPAGQKVLLLGPSGAGKSTLLYALAGILEVDELSEASGALRVGGQDVFTAKQPVGLMQQDPETQIVQSRVVDDVAFGAENLGVDPELIRERITPALQAVGLGALDGEHRTAHLSGGQKQRLALAGILAMEPGLMLLDEPTANIDPEGVPALRDAVLSAAESTGATLIVVEHRLEAWADAVDRVVVLAPGGGVAHDVDPQALFTDRQLRAELSAAGLWVPGIVPETTVFAGTPGAELLHAQDLVAARSARAPKTAAVDLKIRAGAAYCIRGANGAGKSTLALTLGGLLEPSSGTLRASEDFAGELSEQPFSWKAGKLIARIGTVFQEPEHQFVTQSVREELEFAPRRAHAADPAAPAFDEERIAARVDQLLRRLRLEDLAEANPFTLSGGEKRRLSVATVLAADPQVLILDEPTFGQDANTWRELVQLLIEALEAGTAVIAVTHDEQFSAALAAQELQLPAPRETSEATRRPGPMLDAPLGESWLAGINPLAKLAAVAAATLPLVSTMDWVSASVIIVATLVALPLAGLRLLSFLRRAWPLLAAGAVAGWGVALVGEDAGRILLHLGVFTVTEGSVAAGAATGLRAIGLAIPMVLLVASTNPSDLGGALSQQLRVPHRFVLGALAGMRLLGLLTEEFTTLALARRARGVGNFGSPLQRLRAQLGQCLALLVQAVRRASRLAVTMEAKGFGTGERTWIRSVHFGLRDLLVIVAGVVLGAGAIAAALGAGTFHLVWS